MTVLSVKMLNQKRWIAGQTADLFQQTAISYQLHIFSCHVIILSFAL